MILLESYDNYDDLVELEPVSGTMHVYSRRENPQLANRPIRGTFSRLDNHKVFLYRGGERLHFRIDEQDFELTGDVHIVLSRGDTYTLTVLRTGTTIFRLDYTPYVIDEADKWRMYLNPFIEEEHLDFGLFACNMTEDIEKRGKIYR